MSKPAEEDPDLIPAGTVLKDRWEITSKIGKGGFGEVYEAIDLRNDELVAIKVEGKVRPGKLGAELAVLKRLRDATNSKHMCRLLGYGLTEDFTFLVMSLLGKNLAQLRLVQPGRKYTLTEAVHIGLQALEAIKELHSIGVLHRDIKPSNLAVGRDAETAGIVYLLDFGLARIFMIDGKLRPPRAAVPFRGTVRYASVNAHRNVELGRHDDLWSLLYVIVESVVGRLPWSRQRDRCVVGAIKQRCDAARLCKSLPMEFTQFYDHLSSLDYQSSPDYEYLRSLLLQCLETRRIGLNDINSASQSQLAESSAAESTQHRAQEATRAVDRATDDGYSSARPREYVDEDLRVILSSNNATISQPTNTPIVETVVPSVTDRSDTCQTNQHKNADYVRPVALAAECKNRVQPGASPETETQPQPSVTSTVTQHANSPTLSQSQQRQRQQQLATPVPLRVRSASADGFRGNRYRESSDQKAKVNDAFDAVYFTFTSSMEQINLIPSSQLESEHFLFVPKPPPLPVNRTGDVSVETGSSFRRRRYRPSPSKTLSTRFLCM